MQLSKIGTRSAVDNARYRPHTLEERAAGCGPTFDLRTRYILGYILRRHTTREFPSFDPEKGILIISPHLAGIGVGHFDLIGRFNKIARQKQRFFHLFPLAV